VLDSLRLTIGTGVETSVRQLHTELAGLCGAPDEPGPGPCMGLRTGLAETVEWLHGDLRVSSRAADRP
jgi:hypothetical protein